MLPAIIGGAIAAGSIASNLYNSYKNRQSANNAYNDFSKAADSAVASNARDINSYRNLVGQQYGKGAQKYSQALQDFLDSDVYQNDGFQFTGDVGDYFDPAANQRVGAAMTAIDNGAASGGNRFSSDYVNRVANKQQALASEEWEKAYNRLLQDRQQQLNEWNMNSQNAWNNYNATQDRAKYAVDAYGNDRDQYVQSLGDATMAAMNNRLGGLQTQANVAAGRVNAMQNQNAGGALASALGPIAQFAGSYFGSGS